MKKYTKHIPIFLLFIVISFTYFSPVLKREALDAHDAKTWRGISKESRDFRESTGEEALWTNSLFSGMPAYLVSTQYPSNLVKYISKTIQLGIPRPANLLWLYLLGFYILLVSLKIDYRISAIGAIAFAFSSYFFIIIDAGHMTKAHAIAYVPMVVAAVLYTYRGKLLLGGTLTALTVALEIYANHLQITYYLFLIILLIVLVQFVKDLKRKRLPEFFKRSAVLLLAALLASGTSISRLMTTLEYGEYSIRGKSELSSNQSNKTSGLDKDYATQWSYGIAETMTLLVPNFYGGASAGPVSENSETYKLVRDPKNVPLYWGDQPVTSGPTYAGSIIIFLFILGIFLVKSEMRKWLLLATALSIMLAWGKNFMWLTNLFLEYFPGYNKFRAVSMILIIAEFTIPLLAILALNHFLSERKNQEKINKLYALKTSFFITSTIVLLVFLFGIMTDFTGPNDYKYNNEVFETALQDDRSSLFFNDTFRSLIFIALAFGVLWVFLKHKVYKEYIFLALGFLILLDMWTVNKRYLNNDDFVKQRSLKVAYRATVADNFIDKDKSLYFRVFNTSVSTFNDASTSYRHNSIGGYHGAKIRRYQDLIEQHLQKLNIYENKKEEKKEYYTHNADVLSMLNTKWIIQNPNQQSMLASNGYYVIPYDDNIRHLPSYKTALSNQEHVRLNDATAVVFKQKNYLKLDFKEPLGNAWFINSYKIVSSADQEINSLLPDSRQVGSKFRNWAVVNEEFKEHLIPANELDNQNSTISLEDYRPNYLKYQSNSNRDGIAVFSEIYYEKGWKAYIDGEEKPHFRVNYVLRAMQIPSGKHVVEFKFEPETYYNGEKIALASSIFLLMLLVFACFKEFKSSKA